MNVKIKWEILRGRILPKQHKNNKNNSRSGMQRVVINKNIDSSSSRDGNVRVLVAKIKANNGHCGSTTSTC